MGVSEDLSLLVTCLYWESLTLSASEVLGPVSPTEKSPSALLEG